MFNWSPKNLLKNKKQKQSHESRTALNIQKNNAIQKIPQSLALLHGSVWHWLQPHAHPILSNSEVSTQPKYDFWQREQMRSLWSREVRLISWEHAADSYTAHVATNVLQFHQRRPNSTYNAMWSFFSDGTTQSESFKFHE